jgi:[ribosomal protein S18]-alanine N-acetyltransferase
MKQRFVIRRARPSDVDRILAVERAGFGKWAWDRKLFAEYMAGCGDLFLVLEAAGKVTGYAITCINQRFLQYRAELVSIAVSPSLRGKGAADALMDSILRRLRARGVSRLALTVKVTNERARRFYERYGFRRVRRVPAYYEDGADGLLFHRDL